MTSKLSGVRADCGYSYQALEKRATSVRKTLQLGCGEAIDPLRLFEDLHEITITIESKAIPLSYGVIEMEDSEGYARYDRAKKRIEVLASELTYSWLEEGHPRGAYFVAHELGHCLLHTNQLIRLAQMPKAQQAAFHRGRSDHKPYEDTEWQANAFAGSLLMPARGLAALEEKKGRLTTSLIVSEFGVSNEAAGYRLQLYSTRKGVLLEV